MNQTVDISRKSNNDSIPIICNAIEQNEYVTKHKDLTISKNLKRLLHLKYCKNMIKNIYKKEASRKCNSRNWRRYTSFNAVNNIYLNNSFVQKTYYEINIE